LVDKPQTGNANILVVDDEQIVLNLVEDTLTDEGYNVTTTPSPKQAIDLVKQQTFDFILTDIRMPEMNGIELVKEIHKITPTIGVIFMTGYANLDTAKQAIKEGAYDYIMKPFELSEIRQAITRAVEQKQNATKATLSKELNKIADLSNLMYASGDLASLLRLSLSFAIIQNDAEAGIAVYFDRTEEQVVLMQATKVSSNTQEAVRIGMNIDDWTTVPHLPFTCLMQNEEQHPLFSTTLFQSEKEKFLPDSLYTPGGTVIVPLVRADQMLGFIALFHDNADYELKDSDTQVLNFISSQLAISLENLQLLQDSREAYRRLEYLQDQTIQMEKMATRGQMSAEIGHELNNYLGVVVANFQLMNLRIQKGVTEGLERFTDSITDHLGKISRFTKGLMDYSSFKKANFETVDVNQMAERIVEFLQPQKRFRDFEIEIKSEIDKLEAELDLGLIEQVFYNLLNNAADASVDSEIKKIEISITKADDNKIRMAFRDYGKGIGEESLRRLFKEKFTTKDSGHGIGLVVCKNIIDKHQGHIKVESNPAGGTEFIIDLPLKQVSAAEPVAAETV
jgi:signal transduction histidine kinase/CheY-like chemotaxis protein